MMNESVITEDRDFLFELKREKKSKYFEIIRGNQSNELFN
jgi:hypothetical protein